MRPERRFEVAQYGARLRNAQERMGRTPGDDIKPTGHWMSETMKIRTGIIGCGAMGGSMARRLADCGVDVSVFDANERIRDEMAHEGMAVAASAIALVVSVDLLILSLPNADSVAQVMTEVHESLTAGCIVLDTSTSEPATSQRLSARAAQRGYTFLDGPVSGGPAAATNGSMTMLLGGDMAALVRIEPVLDLLTGKRVPVGASGAGHAAKIANNLLCAANLVLVAEALKLGEAAGVPAASLLEGVNAGSGRSGVSEINYPRWVLSGAYDSGFTMGLMRKDVRLALALAEHDGIELPGFSGIARLWEESAETIPDSADFNEIYRYEGGPES